METNRGRIKVLIVDDDKGFRSALARYLWTQDWDCVEAESGDVACRLARMTAFDIAIVDCWMPEKSGFETMHALFAVDPLLPVMLISAMGTEATAREALRQGAADFLSKSMAPSDLAFKMTRLAKESQVKRRMDEACGGADPERPSGTILLVDDHDGFRRAAARTMRQAGYCVREASCGSAAMAICSHERLDGAIIDLHLPDTSGIELARLIRTLREHVPAVIISGEANQDDRRAALQFGITGCIAKIDASARLGAVARVLVEDARRSRRKEALSLLPDPPMVERVRLAITDALRRGRRWSRQSEARVYVAGLATAAIISVLVLNAISRLEQRQFELGDRAAAAEQSVSIFSMYDRIVGYLERDEQRELEQRKRS